MDVVIQKDVIDRLGTAALTPFGYSEDQHRWKKEFEVDLANLTKARARAFRALLATAADLPRVKARLADVDRWLSILDGETVRVRKLKDFASMLKQYLKEKAPNRWLYEKRPHSDVWQPYYVSGISYTPPKRDCYDGHVPGFVSIKLYWEEFGAIHSTSDHWRAEDCEDLTVGRALAEKGYQTETPELAAAHKANVARYAALHDKIGFQVTADGVGEPEAEHDDYWWRRASNIVLERDGVRSRLVVDVLDESGKKKAKGESRPSGEFWRREGCDHEGSAGDDDKDLAPGDEDDEDPVDVEAPNIPLAPALMCFDLKRHVRLKVYADQLRDYRYQTDLGTKLILPDEVTGLVDLLVSHRGGFKDIVGDKGGGAIILCAGRPGTGKTLTAEVYSEAMSRPLYSVQCSQLGTDPDELEKELLQVFARAARWGAILLLDEADVYVAARGSDLVQNAIVGVFLRTLEYYGGVMFMTTNRADLVDDAVASRCLARIDYRVPTPPNQKRIWRTLADTAGITMADAEIDTIVAEFPGLSGRDVKNLLKLAAMVAAANGADVTAATVRYVKQFKPTEDGAS